VSGGETPARDEARHPEDQRYQQRKKRGACSLLIFLIITVGITGVPVVVVGTNKHVSRFPFVGVVVGIVVGHYTAVLIATRLGLSAIIFVRITLDLDGGLVLSDACVITRLRGGRCGRRKSAKTNYLVCEVRGHGECTKEFNLLVITLRRHLHDAKIIINALLLVTTSRKVPTTHPLKLVKNSPRVSSELTAAPRVPSHVIGTTKFFGLCLDRVELQLQMHNSLAL
jgi:hypothetical protein